MFLRRLLPVLLGVTLLGASSPMTLAQQSAQNQPPAKVKESTEDFKGDPAKAGCQARLKGARGFQELRRQEKETLADLNQLEEHPEANSVRIGQVRSKLSALRRQLMQELAKICGAPGGPAIKKP